MRKQTFLLPSLLLFIGFNFFVPFSFLTINDEFTGATPSINSVDKSTGPLDIVVCSATGSLTREYWANVPGSEVSSVPVNSKPTSTSHLTSFETPANTGNNYGQRFRGYLCPPTTGNYIFYIAADETAELWLSTSEDPAGKRKVAFVSSRTSAKQWTKSASQKSATVSLVANTKYYIEALHKEATGADHFAVGWQTPSSSSILVIPGSVLSQFFTANQPPTVNISSPTNNATFTAPATINLSANAQDADGSIQKVEFFNGSALIGTATAAPYTVTWNNVAAGTYSLTAKATDNSGLSTTSATVTIHVTTSQQPPTVTIVSPATNSNFSSPASITIVADAKDTDGAISKVDFFNGSVLIGTVTSAPYSILWNVSNAGVYSISAKATDNSGLFSTSQVITINVGTTQAPPSVNLTSPAPNATFTAPATITLSANAQDADGSIQKVEFFNGSALIGTATAAPYTVTWNNVAAGTYSLTAKATDNSGLSSISPAITVSGTLVKLSPSVVINTPLPNSLWTAPAAVSIMASAADTDGSIQKVEFFNDSTLIGTATAAPYTVTWNNVAAGTYSLTAKATDNQGLSTTSASIGVSVEVPKVPPTINISSPAAGNLFTTPATIALSARAFDMDGTIQKVEFFNGASLIGTVNSLPYTVTWTNMAAGAYNITAKATDNSGLTTFSEPLTVRVRDAVCSGTGSILREYWANITGKPVIYIPVSTPPTSVTQLSSFEVPSNVGNYYGQRLRGYLCAPVTGLYTFYISSDDYSELLLSKSGNPAARARIAWVSGWTNPKEWTKYASQKSLEIQLQANNTYYIEALHTEEGGGDHMAVGWALPGTSTISVIPGSSLIPFPLSAQAPEISLTEPANNSLYSSMASITVSANAQDADGSIQKVEFFNGTTLIGTATTAPYAFTWPNVAQGNYSLTAKATDNSGNTNTSATVRIIVGSSQTTAPTVSISSPAMQSSFTAPAAVSITANAQDADGSIQKVEFFNGTTLIGTATTAPYAFTWPNVAAGSYSLTAKATDNSGLSATSPVVAVNVEPYKIAPTVSISSPAMQSSFTAPAAVSITANAQDADGSIQKVEFFNGTTLIGTATTAPYAFTWPNVAAGSYSLTAKATDNSGLSTVTCSTNIIVQPFGISSANQPPTQPSNVNPVNGAVTNGTSNSLCVTVNDVNNSQVKVSFFGRKKVSGKKFNMILLPDTQRYTGQGEGGTNEMFKSQTNWVAGNIASKNIVYVGHLGDCVENGDLYEVEWKRADTAIRALENNQLTGMPEGVPYGISVGNHDQSPQGNVNGTTNFYNQYFGVQRFENRSYYGGHAGTKNNNHFQHFTGSGINFLVLSLEYGGSSIKTTLDWADSVVKANPSKKVIVMSHYVMNGDSTLSFSGDGSRIYNRLKIYPNVLMMLGGHETRNLGEAFRTDVFNGNVLHTIYQDYQARKNGGNGLLRLYEFDPSRNKVIVQTYSPFSDEFEKDYDSQFTMAVDLTTTPEEFTLIGEINGAVSGTNACINWALLDPYTEYEWYVKISDGQVTTTSPIWTFTTQSQNVSVLESGSRRDKSLEEKNEQKVSGSNYDIYPNPNSSQQLIVDMKKNMAGNVSLEIFGMNGQRFVSRAFINPDRNIRVEHNLPSGIYQVIIKTPESNQSKKLIVVK